MSMDETKGTPGDESTKGTPKDESKGTPKDKGKLYTSAEIDKVKSDAAAMGQGRAEKVAEREKVTLTQELQTTKSRLDALEQEVNESRRAEARGDPAALTLLNRGEAVTKRERYADNRERDLGRREEQVKFDQTEVDRDKGVVNIAYIAAKHGLETEKLESLNISDPETLERVAEELAGAKPKGTGEGGGGEGGEGGDKPDSGDGAGAGELTEQQKLDQRFPTMKKP